jgi:hypothetical protein
VSPPNITKRVRGASWANSAQNRRETRCARDASADVGEAQVIPSIYKIGFANLAGSGAGSTVSSFWRAITPPIGSLTMSETTTLETL